MSLNPWRPDQRSVPEASRCSRQFQNRGRSWPGLPRLRGDVGQPQEIWAGQAQLWAAASPACAPGGSVPPAGDSGHVLPWEEDATGDRKGLPASAKGSVDTALGGAGQRCRLPAALAAASQAGPGSPGPARGSRGCAGTAPRPPLQPAVPLTESRDSHNYWDYKERVIDLQPALCDQRPGAPPLPPTAHLSYCKHETIYKCFISLIASPLLHNNNPSSTAIYSLHSPSPRARSLQKAPT